MSKQEKFGVSEQREKVRRVLAVQDYVYEIELCAEIDGLLDSPLWEDDSLDPFLKRDDILKIAIQRSVYACTALLAERDVT